MIEDELRELPIQTTAYFLKDDRMRLCENDIKQICQLLESKPDVNILIAKGTEHPEERIPLYKPDDGITCPFCGDSTFGGFDKIGLKWHLNNHCEVYRDTEDK